MRLGKSEGRVHLHRHGGERTAEVQDGQRIGSQLPFQASLSQETPHCPQAPPPGLDLWFISSGRSGGAHSCRHRPAPITDTHTPSQGRVYGQDSGSRRSILWEVGWPLGTSAGTSPPGVHVPGKEPDASGLRCGGTACWPLILGQAVGWCVCSMLGFPSVIPEPG